MTDGQAEKGKSKVITRKKWDYNMITSHIEVNNIVTISSTRNRTLWRTIQGVIGRVI